MTYCYTRNDAKLASIKSQMLETMKAPFQKTSAKMPFKMQMPKLKTLAIAAVAATLLVVAFSPKTATKTDAVPALRGAKVSQPITPQKKIAPLPSGVSYTALDNKIRDVQINNADIGHSMKMVMISDRNPIKRAHYWTARNFSIPALLVGISFLITMLLLGFVRPAGEDLSNY